MRRTHHLMLAMALSALAGVAAGGAAAQVREDATPRDLAAPRDATKPRAGSMAQRTPAFPAMDDLQATRDRPLFNPSRRPPDPPPAPDEAAEAAPPVQEAASLPFELTGTVIGSELKVAILRDRQTMEEVRLHEGEQHGPWKIDEVSARYVLFRNEGRRVRLRLFDEAAKAGDLIKVRRVGEAEDEESPPPDESTATETEAVEEEVIVPDQAPEARPPSDPAPRPQHRPARRESVSPDENGGRQQRRQLNTEQLQRQQREQMRIQQQQQARQQIRQPQGRQQQPQLQPR